jgi:hypothetical protein
VEILSGLQPGEAIIVVGSNGLRDSAEVRVMSGPATGLEAGTGP